MSRLTPLFLLVLVGVLGYFAFRQTQYERDNPLQQSELLFAGVEQGRMVGLRVESLEYSRHFGFEVDGARRWFLTDPMRWPVDVARFGELQAVLARNKGEPIPEALRAEAEASFNPPRGFIESIEKLADGTERKVRVEVGAGDIDGVRVFVRRGDEIFRTARNIEAPLKWHMDEFRSRVLFGLPGMPKRIERIGGWYEDGNLRALGFDATFSGQGWQLKEPHVVAGDEAVFGLWLAFLSRVQAVGFASDIPEPDLAAYGLDSPHLTVRLSTASGGATELHVSSVEGNSVFARRGNHPTIYTLDREILPYLLQETSTFYAAGFARVERRELKHVWVDGRHEQLRIDHTKDGDWMIAARPEGAERFGQPMKADADRVSDLIAAIEGAEVAQYFTDIDVDDLFGEGSETLGLFLEPYGAPAQGGRFSATVTTLGGTDLVPFHREGESIVGGMDPSVAEWAKKPIEFYLDRLLWGLTDARLKKLEITDVNSGASRNYVRGKNLSWRPADAAVPAPELDPVLDHLIFLRAANHFVEAERPELTEVIAVTFTDALGKRHEAQIGLAATEVQLRVGPLQSVADHQPLHAALMGLLEGD